MNDQFKSVSERVEQFRQFYRKENAKPLFGFFRGSEYPLHRYPCMKDLPEDRPLVPEDFPLEAFLADTEELFQGHESCGGDFIFSATPFWGIPWVEAALGCPIFVSHETGSIYSEPPEGFKGSKSLPDFDKSNPWLQLMEKFLLGLAQKSSGRWPIGTTRMRGVSDLLAATYGGTEWIMKMMEDPEEIHSSCRKLTNFWMALARFQINLIPPYHEGIGSFYYYSWAPKGTVWCQEDAAALLSPSLYEEFIEPCIREISENLKGSIMHQHSTGYIPYKSYKTMAFDALEMHVDQGGPSAEQLYETHKELMADKPLIIWGEFSQDDLDWIFSKLPTEGLAVIAVVNSPGTAAEMWHQYMQ